MNDELLAAWRNGINPYPRLAMDESWTLLTLMDGRSLDAECQKISLRLQRKACGMKPQPRCSCGETENLTECRAIPDSTYHLCPVCKADEELS